MFLRHGTKSIPACARDGLQAQLSDLDNFVVIQEGVVPHVAEHRRIELGHCDVIAGFSESGNRLYVIVMSVGLEDPPDAERAAQFEKCLVFVRGIDQDCLAGLATADDEDVVVEWTDDDLVHLDACVAPVEDDSGGMRCHGAVSLPHAD